MRRYLKKSDDIKADIQRRELFSLEAAGRYLGVDGFLLLPLIEDGILPATPALRKKKISRTGRLERWLVRRVDLDELWATLRQRPVNKQRR